MNNRKAAIASAIGVVAIAAMLFAYPAMASGQTSNTLSGIGAAAPGHHRDFDRHRISLSVGQKITLTSVAGGYREVGNPQVNGTATGTMTLVVTGSFRAGYALSVTGGSITINGTVYTISGGTGVLGPYGVQMLGQGQASDGSQFLFHGRNLGRFGSSAYGILGIDLQSSGSEFAVRLLVTVSA
jgi:hypothetical protein